LDKAITTALLIIAGVVCMIFLFNSVYPMINRSSEAMTSMAETVDERMKSRINIVHAANNAGRTEVYLWVKNVGTQMIDSVEESDLFFGEEDSFNRIPNVADSPVLHPSWDYELVNDDRWGTSATIKITITYDVDPGAGTYFAKFIIPNGISDDFYFSM
jgi:hypothetical protein